MSDQSHKRQEDIHTIEQHRKELTVLEENERMKLQTRLKVKLSLRSRLPSESSYFMINRRKQ